MISGARSVSVDVDAPCASGDVRAPRAHFSNWAAVGHSVCGLSLALAREALRQYVEP